MSMEEKKLEFKEWVKEHKKQLVFAGISTAVIVGIILGIKNQETLMEIWEFLRKQTGDSSSKTTMDVQKERVVSNIVETVQTTRKYTLPKESFDVSQHIRILPEGRQHSLEKAIEAETLGIILAPNETLVDSYPKYAAA